MQLSVIILNYNVEHFLYICLQSVFKSIEGLDAEVIVVDNASKDSSCQMVKTCFPQATLMENKHNIGFAKANNQAVSHAKGEYICILNPDTIISEFTFINVLQKAQVVENLGILGVQLIDGKGRFLPESKRNLPTPKVSFFKLFGEKYAEKAPYYANNIPKNGEGKTSIFVGAFMLMKKEIYTQVGGFDEDYFMYGEDIDLSYKIKKAGYTNYYYGSEKIIHFKGESTLKDSTYRKRFFGAMKLFYQKHFKSHFAVNSFFYLGIKFASLTTKKEKKALPFSFQKIALLSNSKELQYKIEEKLNKLVRLTAVNEVYANKNIQENVLCFLDMNFIDYSQAIMLIASNEAYPIYFRFIPKKYKIALGSDASTSRGQLISLN